MDEAVVAAGPEGAGLVRRLGEGIDGAVALGAGVVSGDRAAGGTELVRVVAGQVRTDRLPTLPLVGGPEDDVAGGVEDAGVVGGEADRESPGEPVFHVPRRPPEVLFGPDVD